jgi:hypothetical protein
MILGNDKTAYINPSKAEKAHNSGVMPIIQKEALKFAKTYNLKDRMSTLLSNGKEAVLKALRNHTDKSRPGNSFITFITPHIVQGIKAGVGAGLSAKPARTAVKKMLEAKSAARVQPLIAVIAPENREFHDDIESYDKDTNPYGVYSPSIHRLGSELIGAMNANDYAGIRRIKGELENLLNKIETQEDVGIGALTGEKTPISIPHSGDETLDDFKKMQFISTQGKETDPVTGKRAQLDIAQGADRRSLHHGKDYKDDKQTTDVWPNLNSQETMHEPDKRDMADVFSAAVKFALSQPQGFLGTGKIKPIEAMSEQEARWVVRRLGLDAYPTKGSKDDFEVTADGQQSPWLAAGCPQLYMQPERSHKLSLRGNAPAVERGVERPMAQNEATAFDAKTMEKFGQYLILFRRYELDESKVHWTDYVIVERAINRFRRLVAESVFKASGPSGIRTLYALYG